MVKRISVFITTIPQMFLRSFNTFPCIIYTSKQLRAQHTSQISVQAPHFLSLLKAKLTMRETQDKGIVGKLESQLLNT